MLLETKFGEDPLIVQCLFFPNVRGGKLARTFSTVLYNTDKVFTKSFIIKSV